MQFSSRTPLGSGLRYMIVTLLMGGSLQGAQGVLDQSVIPNPASAWAGIGSPNTPFELDTAQTFTAGLSGLLSRIDVFISVETYYGNSAEVRWDVRPVSASGAPVNGDTSALASGGGNLASDVTHYSFVTLDLSQNPVPVSAGDRLAIVLSTTSGSLGWAGAPVGYAGGQNWQRSETFNDGFAWHDTLEGYDLGFKTFVVVPEPSSVLLASLGAGLLFWRWRR